MLPLGGTHRNRDDRGLASLLQSPVVIWEGHAMTVIIAGFVKNGVVVPTRHCRRGRSWRSTSSTDRSTSHRSCKPNWMPGTELALDPWSWSNVWPERAKPMQRSEVWRVRLPAMPGHTQAGIRPAVILQEDQPTAALRPTGQVDRALTAAVRP